MKVLFVSTDYPRRGQPTTGLPNYLYRVSLSLIQLGHSPIILAAGVRDNYRVEQGIKIYTVGIKTYPNYKSQALNYAVSALKVGYVLNNKIKELLNKHDVDIIQFTSLYGIALFYNENVPAVLRLSSYAKTAFSSYQTNSPATVRIMSLFEILSSNKCNEVFSPCIKNAVEFGKDCRRKVKVVETPFINDVQEYDNRFYNQYLRGKKYVLFFGSLQVIKGILNIAEILEKFLEENSDYFFAFIGETSYINGEDAVQLLRKRAGKHADKIIISNPLDHKQLYPVIQNADFVVLPSLMENLSNACIEAMYFERVVIGTEGASFEQLIKHGENGLLCRIDDSQDLLEKMQVAVNMSENERREMGRLAGKRIEKLKPQFAVGKLIKLYENVISNNK